MKATDSDLCMDRLGSCRPICALALFGMEIDEQWSAGIIKWPFKVNRL